VNGEKLEKTEKIRENVFLLVIRYHELCDDDAISTRNNDFTGFSMQQNVNTLCRNSHKNIAIILMYESYFYLCP